jgi:fibronectin-binding autotransporter adhesin
MRNKNRTIRYNSHLLGIHVLLPAIFVLLSAAFAMAADNYWNVASGGWSDTSPSPWSLGREPASSDNVHIQNGRTATIGQDGEVCDYLYLGSPGTTSGNMNIVGGSLSVGSYAIVEDGTITQTGGINTVAYLELDSNGQYTLRDTGSLTANYEIVGIGGTGSFTQSGGVNSAGYEIIGQAGTGVFTQTAGVNSVQYLILGSGTASSSGTYTLNGGTLIVAAWIMDEGGVATFNFSGGTLQAGGPLNVDVPMTLTGGGENANIDTAGNSAGFSSILSGSGGLNKLGPGTLTLGAANSYYGNTCIKAGTLSLAHDGSIDNSPVIEVASGTILDVSAKNSRNVGFTLASGQTLTGSGTVNGNLVAGSGSHIDPGDSAGILTLTGKLTLSAGAILDFDLADISASDRIAMSTYTLYLNGQQFSDFDFAALDGFGSGTYTLIDAGMISGNLASSDLSGAIGGYQATLSKSGNDLVLTVVPEPGTLVLLASALVGLLIYGRRKGNNGLFFQA